MDEIATVLEIATGTVKALLSQGAGQGASLADRQRAGRR